MIGNEIYVTQVHRVPCNREDDVFIATTKEEAKQQFKSYIERRKEEFGESHISVKEVKIEEPVDQDDDLLSFSGEFVLEVPSYGIRYEGSTYSVYVGG